MMDADTLAQVLHIGSPEIHARYRELVRKWLPETGLVLKTDAYNEASGGFRHLNDCGLEGRTVCVEYEHETMAVARRKHPDKAIVGGDIRDLRFPADLFHAVVDLSTIDHIEPVRMPQAIGEYRRVLRPDGLLILVVWCWPWGRAPGFEPDEWDPQNQYYWPGDPRGLVAVWFDVLHAGWICRRGDAYLAEVVARVMDRGWSCGFSG